MKLYVFIYLITILGTIATIVSGKPHLHHRHHHESNVSCPFHRGHFGHHKLCRHTHHGNESNHRHYHHYHHCRRGRCSFPTSKPTTGQPPVIAPPLPPIPDRIKALCELNCRSKHEYTPVCGTNGVTYSNMEHLSCARRCGFKVHILCERECTKCNLSLPLNTSPYPPTQETKPTSTPPITPTAKPTAEITKPPEEIKECIKNCSKDETDSPICGTNNITYNNSNHMLCAQICGYNVKALYFGECGGEDGSKIPATSSSTGRPEPTNITLPTSGTSSTDGSSIEDDIFGLPTAIVKFDEFSFDPR